MQDHALGRFLARQAAHAEPRRVAERNRYDRRSEGSFAFVGLSDPTGLYEVTLFSDVLDASRDHLENGANVVVTVEATMEAEQVKLLARRHRVAEPPRAYRRCVAPPRRCPPESPP